MIKKILLSLCLVSVLSLSSIASANEYVYDEQGRVIKETITTGWWWDQGKYYIYTYDDHGNKDSSTYYSKYNEPINKWKQETDYETGVSTMYNYHSASAVNSNTPDTKEVVTPVGSDGMQTSTYYDSSSAIASDTPDRKQVYGVDSSSGVYSETWWWSAESVASDTPDYRREAYEDSQNGKYIEVEYDGAEYVSSNQATYRAEEFGDPNTGASVSVLYQGPDAVSSGEATYKEEYWFDEETGQRISRVYEGNSAVSSNVPTVIGVQKFDEEGNQVSLNYNSDGQFIGGSSSGYHTYDAMPELVYDENGKISKILLGDCIPM